MRPVTQKNDSATQLHDAGRSAASVYRGTIRHRRFSPITHGFRYRITMLMLDLDFVEQDLKLPPLISGKSAALGWFRRKDYIGEAHDDLKQHILDRVEQKTGSRPNGKVLLLTHLRYWGFVMNPISIFYCYNRSSELVATALQVTNTPWGEKILYILPANIDAKKHFNQFPKQMHVSPFNPMDMTYLCRFQAPSDKLFFHLENHQEDSKITDATMVFQYQEMTCWRLARLVLTQPAMTVKVGFGIYWQALKLWVKGAPVFDHPDESDSVPATLESNTSIRHSE